MKKDVYVLFVNKPSEAFSYILRTFSDSSSDSSILSEVYSILPPFIQIPTIHSNSYNIHSPCSIIREKMSSLFSGHVSFHTQQKICYIKNGIILTPA